MLAERALIAATARPGRRTQALNRALFQASLRGLGYCGSWLVDRSGEAWFLEWVVGPAMGCHRGVIVDVGANRGDYARAALQHTNGRVVAFEPQPACWESLDDLADQFRGRVDWHGVALGASGGSSTIRYGDAGSEWASLATTLPAFAEQAVAHTATVRVEILDDMVDTSDPFLLLKIDVEGWEREVLLGAQVLLTDPARRPQWVQIEWNLHQLYRGHTLRDLADLLPGYRPFVLLPHGMRPLDLDRPEDNVFSYANLVFQAVP
jgi:FkbM family methyltransferase